MKKLTKTLTPLLLAGITLSLMCGCENGTAKDKNNSVSGGSSATQSTANDKSGTSSKDDSSKNDKTSKPSESGDQEYEEIMKLVNQLPKDATHKEVHDVFGEPDEYSLMSSKGFDIYYFSKYKVVAESTPEFKISVIDLSKPTNPYDENTKYDSEFMEVLNKVDSIKQNSTKEEVVKILDEPDRVSDNPKDTQVAYDFGNYAVNITYIKSGLLLDIYNSKTGETVNVLYPS